LHPVPFIMCSPPLDVYRPKQLPSIILHLGHEAPAKPTPDRPHEAADLGIGELKSMSLPRRRGT
jgi:hypothetical protein